MNTEGAAEIHTKEWDQAACHLGPQAPSPLKVTQETSLRTGIEGEAQATSPPPVQHPSRTA